ncbi:phage integrase SAM-like domain-containing protein [Winogradskyella eximia]|uniref:phage integrase SAM-like domain-containing protein n=1 Tax=Winogradskyella eximia TaxID=262006 RepID=UPI002490BAEF|nr:phage integrase SAM-like domain-containing protein [Winogradskyella eximia]
MATIKFLLQSKTDNAPIYLRLSLGRVKGLTKDEKPKYISYKRKTGLSINPKDWSNDKGLPKQNYADNKNLTSKLRNLKTKILDELNEANSNGSDISAEWLNFHIDLHFERITENIQSEFLTDAIQDIIDNADTRKNAKGGLGLSKSRINSYKSLKRFVTEYQSKDSFKVKDVNVKFAKEFLRYLLDVKGYQKSYATKKIADLKTVCFDAETNGIEVHFQLKKIDSTKPTNDNIIYLSKDELQQIEDAEIHSKSLQNVRKWLLLGCNIGQRGGDLLNINETNFVIRKGLQVIELNQQKTGKNVTIPLLETTKKILETGLPYKISIQKFNKHVKTICQLAEINEIIKGGKIEVTEIGKGRTHKRKVNGTYEKWELIGSHVCRRSFASNSYGELPTPLIMSITAHSTEKMLLNYIGKQGLDYAQQIADFYELQKLKEKKEPQLNIVKQAN